VSQPALAGSSDEQAAASLQPFCKGVPQVIHEGDFLFVRLPGLRFQSQGCEFETEGLLVPQTVPSLGGYTTRLLLEHAVPKPLSWSTVVALGRSWHTWSWNNVPPEWPWPQILAAHLKALA
jgi:hypothetical protein